MKAIRLHRRGGPEQIVYEDAPKPELQPGDALVKVYATGITPAELTWDETYHSCDGLDRLPTIPGHELSGVVEKVADGPGDVSIGDEVYALTPFVEMAARQSMWQFTLLIWRRNQRHSVTRRRRLSRFRP